jgi:hypothetical protein
MLLIPFLEGKYARIVSNTPDGVQHDTFTISHKHYGKRPRTLKNYNKNTVRDYKFSTKYSVDLTRPQPLQGNIKSAVMLLTMPLRFIIDGNNSD